MAELGGKNKISGVFGGVEMGNTEATSGYTGTVGTVGTVGNTENAGTIGNAGTIRNNNLPTKTGFWSKFKAFWLQEIDWNKEIKVVLTPYEQKIEDEINEFLHQEITWEKVHDFLFQEISFGRKNKNK